MEQERVIKILEGHVGIKFYGCNSSNVVAFGYNQKDKSLWVAFKGDKVYRYQPISQEQFEELKLADSKGKWVNANMVKSEIKYTIYEIV